MDDFSIVDEKKFYKLDPKKKPLYVGLGLVFFLLIVPAILYLYYTAALNRPAQCTEEKTFIIEKGEGASSVSDRLYAEGLINSKALFNIYVFLNNTQSKLQAGSYKIPAGCNVKALSELFQSGRDDIKVTFLEGWRVEEVAKEASESFSNVDNGKFIELAREHEGKLFPDTYEFNAEVDEESIVKAMLENFKTKTQEVLTDQSSAKVGLTMEQVITLASIVEREVINVEDRKIVAGIFIKRLQEGMPLGADATTQYAVAPKGGDDWWPKSITAEDLESDSPYNTRKITGLPPTPICSPGLDAIIAVLENQNSDYYYYLTDSSGITHYARTLDEHNINITRYL